MKSSITLLELLLEDLTGTAPSPSTPVPDQTDNWEQEAEDLGFSDPMDLIDAIQQDGARIEAAIDGDLPPEQGEQDVDGSSTDEEEPEDNPLSTNRLDSVLGIVETPAMAAEAPAVNGSNLTDARALALQVVANSKGAFKLDRRDKGAYRLQLVNDNDKAKVPQLIISAMVGFKAKVIAPGNPGASSGRYNTYILAKSAKETTQIVFAAGKNEGQKFEKTLKNSVASRKGFYWELLTASLKRYYGIRPQNVKSIVKKAGGASSVKRPFTATMSDVGSLLSDMDINLTKQFKLGDKLSDKVHVSIKNLKGSTFVNAGYTDGFAFKTGRTGVQTVVATESKTAAVEGLLAALGVDKNIIAKGLTDYNNLLAGKKVKSNHAYYVRPAVNRKLVEKLLAAQLGYGYLYARQTKDGLKMLDLYNPEKVVAQVGTIIGVALSYPFVDGTKKSKQLTALIKTTTGKFAVEVRSTKGGVLPDQLNIKFD